MRNTETTMVDQPAPWERLALASGIAFSLLQFASEIFAAAAIFPRKPAMDAPPAEHAAHYAQDGTLYLIGNYLIALPAPFFILFVAGLYTSLRRAGGGALATAVAGAGVAAAMMWPFGCMLTNLGHFIAKNGGDAATVVALDGLAPLSLALGALPRALLLAGAGVVLLASGRAPRWLGWTGCALGLLSLAGSATLVVGTMFPVLMIGTMLFEIWVIALSVSLLRDTRLASQASLRAVPA